jgi:hypothetical protein
MRSGFSIMKMFSAAVFLLPALAGAFCGLQSCPRVNPHGGSHPFEAGLRTRVVQFDYEEESGFYGVLSPRFFAKVRGVSLGIEVPWVVLRTEDIRVSGLGNPLLIAQYARRVSRDWSLETGLQFELPLGDYDHGLADDHFMFMPWVGVRKEWGERWYTSGMLGASLSLQMDANTYDDAGDMGASARVAPRSPGSSKLAKASHNGVDHGVSRNPVYVNPHGDREIHWRAALGLRLWDRWTFEDFFLGQADLTKPDENPKTVHYVRNGVSAEWAVTPSVALQAVADAPVTSARRSEAALGIDVKVAW